MDKDVFIVEKNVRGAWVIFGALGVRQYYGYSKAEAVKKDRESVKQQIMEVKDGKKRQAVGGDDAGESERSVCDLERTV